MRVVSTYTNGFDCDIAGIYYRVEFVSTPMGGVTNIKTLVNDQWDYEKEIYPDVLEEIRAYCLETYNMEF